MHCGNIKSIPTCFGWSSGSTHKGQVKLRVHNTVKGKIKCTTFEGKLQYFCMQWPITYKTTAWNAQNNPDKNYLLPRIFILNQYNVLYPHLHVIQNFILIWKEETWTQLILLIVFCIFYIIYFIHDCSLYTMILQFILEWTMLHIRSLREYSDIVTCISRNIISLLICTSAQSWNNSNWTEGV